MRAFILAAALLVATSSAMATRAGGTSAPQWDAGAQFGQDPPASVLVVRGTLEWIWAAPCASIDPSCGAPTKHHGFTDPTAAQWGTWANLAELVTAFTVPQQLCGSPWMSSVHSHCDTGDLQNGHIWHATGLCDPAYFDGCEAPTTETFFVRVIPEPQTYALMAAGLGVMGWFARRRKPVA